MLLEIFIIGCGGTQPLPRRHLSSIMVRRNGQSFLFDCGEGTQISLKRQGLRWKNISHMFISHIHADHVTGIPGLMMLSSQVERVEPLHIVAPKGVCDFISGICKSLNIYINYPFRLRHIEFRQESQVLYEDDELKISCFPLVHSQPTVGFLVEEKMRPGIFVPERAAALAVPRGPLWGALQRGQTVQNERGETVRPEDVLGEPRPGARLAFMTDTLYHEKAAEYVQDVDLLICEGMFARDLTENAHEKKHMTAPEAALIAKTAGVQQLALTHFSPRYLDRELKTLLSEAQEIFPETILCRDGLHWTLQATEGSAPGDNSPK
ncbi:ribonuclease Z [Candidatus Haliotispira prima]|uniref:Ribonuclease Z n=1 Tax=Candidatus Haliotispira prima TaxID=3034016 RepID=A0ABY8MKC1_9SPIO|nr:ribonuclease Z [Candidatus Haliotispira prima]